jgi:hypothetical protein
MRPQYHDRIFALVRDDVAAGVAPLGFELSTAMEPAEHDLRLFRVLLGWSESSKPDVRRAAAGKVIRLLFGWSIGPGNGPPLDDSDKVRLRHVLLTVAPDPAQPARSGIAGLLLHLLDGIDGGEAQQIARIAEMDLSGYRPHDMVLLLHVADRFEELRPRVIARLLGPDLDDAREVADPSEVWPPAPERKWLARAAGEWIRNLKDEALQQEDVQERFLIVAQALRPSRLYWSLQLPSSRRLVQVHRSEPPSQAVGKVNEENEEDEDRKAFGLPPSPASAGPVEPERSVGLDERHETPHTPREKTDRWQKFVHARAVAVRLLQKKAP